MGEAVHQDFVDGYLDGRDLNSPEPSDNRSHRYRHSFDVGRRERKGDNSLGYAAALARAELASVRDDRSALPSTPARDTLTP